jgi:hypothetical protein
MTILTEMRTKFYLLNLNGTNWKMHAQMGKDYPNNLQRSWAWQYKLDSSTQLRLRTSGGCCERGSEYLGYINSGKVFGQVINSYCLLMHASAHYRRLVTAYTPLLSSPLLSSLPFFSPSLYDSAGTNLSCCAAILFSKTLDGSSYQ